MAEVTENAGTGPEPTDPFAELASAFESELSEEEAQQDDEAPQPEQDEPATSEDDSEEAPEAADEGSDDESSETDEETEESEDQPLIPVKVNGEEKLVTIDELKRGYSREQDYTRKTMALAEERKRFEAEELTPVREERARYAQLLSQLEEAVTTGTPQEPNWVELRQKIDGVNYTQADYLAEYEGWQQHKQYVQRVQSEREATMRKLQEDHAKAYQQHLEAQRALVTELIPEWKQPEVAKKERSELVAFAKSQGYTDEELGQVTDARVLKVLRMAYLFDRGQQQKPKLEQRVEKIRTQKPGNGKAGKKPPTAAQRAEQRFIKSGSVEDLATLFLHE